MTESETRAIVTVSLLAAFVSSPQRILSRFTAVLKNEQTRLRVIEAKKSEQVMAILQESR